MFLTPVSIVAITQRLFQDADDDPPEYQQSLLINILISIDMDNVWYYPVCIGIQLHATFLSTVANIKCNWCLHLLSVP